MSWKGFVKAVGRMPQQVMAKAGYAEETIDEEFNALCAQFDELEQSAQKLQQDAAKYKAAVTAMLQHQESFANILLEVYMPIPGRVTSSADNVASLQRTPTPPEAMAAVQEYLGAMSSARETLTPELSNVDRRIVNPAIEFLAVFKNIRKTITKRNHKLLDYDRYRNDVHKMEIAIQKDAKDERRFLQLKQQFEVVSADFALLNDALKQQLPQFLQMRVSFIDPCFQSLYFLQLRVFRTMTQLLEVLRKYPMYDLSLPVGERYTSRIQQAEQLVAGLTLLTYKTTALSISGSESQTSDGVQPPLYSTLPANTNTNQQSTSQTLAHSQSVPHMNAGSSEKSSVPPGGYQPPPSFTQTINLEGLYPPPATIFPGSSSTVAAAGVAAAAGSQFNPFADTASSSSVTASTVPTNSSGIGPKYVVALYDYQAQAPDDLSFRADDRIEVLECTDNVNDWWKGRVEKREGFFPANYVAQI